MAAGAAALVALGLGGVAVATVNPMSPVGRQSTTEHADPAPGEDGTTTPDEAPTTEAPATTEGPPATDAAPPATDAPADVPFDGAPPAADDPADSHDAGDHEGHGPGHRPGHHGRGRLAGILDGLVADGVITQEQADAIRDALAGARGGPGHGAGHGPGRWGGPGVDLDALWDAASEVTGLPADALREGLEDGRSLAEIAEDEGVGREALVDALVAEVTGHLDEAVDAGWLTRERADALAEGVREHVEHLVDLRPPHR